MPGLGYPGGSSRGMSFRRREGNNMRTSPAAPKSIDEYISGFPGDVQAILGRIRTTIKRAAPGAEEAIRYQMPTFVLKGNLISFAAYKKHIGLYPAPTGSRRRSWQSIGPRSQR